MGKNVYKIGKAKNVENRMKGYVTAYAEQCVVVVEAIFDNVAKAEKMVFDQLIMYRMKTNREFFKADIDLIKSRIEVVKLILDTDLNYVYNSIKMANLGEDEDVDERAGIILTKQNIKGIDKHCKTEVKRRMIEEYKQELCVSDIDFTTAKKTVIEWLESNYVREDDKQKVDNVRVCHMCVAFKSELSAFISRNKLPGSVSWTKIFKTTVNDFFIVIPKTRTSERVLVRNLVMVRKQVRFNEISASRPLLQDNLHSYI
jgi:hypothetical protein